jgi:hypothetical protein
MIRAALIASFVAALAQPAAAEESRHLGYTSSQWQNFNLAQWMTVAGDSTHSSQRTRANFYRFQITKQAHTATYGSYTYFLALCTQSTSWKFFVNFSSPTQDCINRATSSAARFAVAPPPLDAELLKRQTAAVMIFAEEEARKWIASQAEQ